MEEWVMRKMVVVACLAVALVLAGLLVFKVGILPAQSGPELAGDAQPALSLNAPCTTLTPQTTAPELPIARVVLYTSGVGYFERAGKVDGNARLNLSFPVQDINDLLKSM